MGRPVGQGAEALASCLPIPLVLLFFSPKISDHFPVSLQHFEIVRTLLDFKVQTQ